MKTEKAALCPDRHGIHENWAVHPHPQSACAELIEMGKTPLTFHDVFMSEGFCA